MKKTEFLDALRAKLSGLPREDLEERLSFLGEMIDDRMEEGMTEEEAVARVGTPREIAEQIISEIPLKKLAKEKIKNKRRMSAAEIVVLILGFPLWFSLLAAAFSVLLGLYVSMWAVIISLWAACVSFTVGAPAGAAAGILIMCQGFVPSGLVTVAAALVCAGLAIPTFYGCLAISKLAIRFTKRIPYLIKRCFVRGGEKA